VKLSFHNTHSEEVTVYAIQASGRRARGRKLAPNDSVAYQARIGGAFVVESKDGKIHEIHSPSWPAKTVIIGDE
jgi:iduronate 2-sulfatase